MSLSLLIKKILVLAFLLPHAPAHGASVQAPPHAACVMDAEILQLPACAIETRDGQLFVARRFLPRLFAPERGPLVAVNLPDGGWSYIDRRGRVVVRNVATMDNYANAFHYGLVRVTRSGKWGLADAHGRLVVPLRYDGMLDYQPGGGWKACMGCRIVGDGEHSSFDGGRWVALDRYGKPK